MRPRTAIAALAIAITALGTAVAVAAEEGSSTTDEQAQLEANRRRQQELAAELGLLEASDVELQAQLDALGTQIAEQEAAVARTEAQLATLRRRARALAGEVEVAQAKVEAQHDLAVERAIAAYVHPSPGKVEVLIGTSDLSEITIKDVLLEESSANDRRVLDGFEAAVVELEERRSAAAEAAEALAQAEADAQEELDLLEAARARQEAVREVLQVRIAEFRGEADELAAQEATLQALIEDRLRPPPTTVPSTTTTLPPTTTTDGGPSTTGDPGTTSTSGPSSTTSTTNPPNPGYDLIWPSPGPVTSTFGMRWGRMHNGIDISDPTGTAVRAAASGEAFFVGTMNGYGNVVLIDHFNGLITLYAHLDSFSVNEGARVNRGAAIGTVGSTGNSTGPHLHFETRIDGIPRDPMAYLP